MDSSSATRSFHRAMTEELAVAIFGATGFIGRSTSTALTSRQVHIIKISTPRLPPPSAITEDVGRYGSRLVRQVAAHLEGIAVVINASGIADATSADEDALTSANATLPGLIGQAARAAGVPRMIQVSSAAVQGRKAVLDDSVETHPFSAYSRSKAIGERQALQFGPDATVVFRPAGVHGIGRAVTHRLARIARSQLACVAAPGDANTPQALLENVGDAIAFLAVTKQTPPKIVNHPSEDITTSQLLTLLGGRHPTLLPETTARAALAAARAVGHLSTSVAAQTRRLEMLWFGQVQAASWLSAAGWTPRLDLSAWQKLGQVLGLKDALRSEHGGTQ